MRRRACIWLYIPLDTLDVLACDRRQKGNHNAGAFPGRSCARAEGDREIAVTVRNVEHGLRWRSRRQGRVLRSAEGPVPHNSRAVRVRQDNPSADDRRVPEPDQRRDLHQRRGGERGAAAQALDRHGLSEAGAVSAHDGGRECRLSAEDASARRTHHSRPRRAISRAGPARQATAAGASTSCPAGSSSASRLRARWCSSPTCCFSTSRWLRSTASCARKCSSNSAASSASSASPRSMSPTTSARRWWFPTRSSSWIRARSSRRHGRSTPIASPRNAFVANFIGVTNFIAGTVRAVSERATSVIVRGDTRMLAGMVGDPVNPPAEGGKASGAIRAEQIRLAGDASAAVGARRVLAGHRHRRDLRRRARGLRGRLRRDWRRRHSRFRPRSRRAHAVRDRAKACSWAGMPGMCSFFNKKPENRSNQRRMKMKDLNSTSSASYRRRTFLQGAAALGGAAGRSALGMRAPSRRSRKSRRRSSCAPGAAAGSTA